ncbi:LysE family translocator [Marinobacter zhejiangensis]|uniref:Threonine/homoserine/homoserine lactone efflux protein n=1 Tax=Marinobacter zhejiangensis TaxID=488535 RepID=A0A1I4THZ0_9GAMM|nr:LysE family translocator [Marinobacter zhejiangensis]SFM76160.1 Threonine/homoserine/homoserine lactone efflux protein [Marinobacter zhejiangensis]
MGLYDTFALFIAMVVLALVPSGSVALVVTRAATAGFAQGVAVVAGIVAGDLVFVCLALLGMAAVADALGGFFVVIKYLAGAYLIWFGATLILSKPPLQTKSEGCGSSSLSVSFFSGLVLTLGDVKAVMFYASFFPAFIDLHTVTATDIAVIVALTLVAVGGVKLGYVFAAKKVAALTGGLRAVRGARIAGGGVMIGAGTLLIAKP